jgi:carbonic anhydrase
MESDAEDSVRDGMAWRRLFGVIVIATVATATGLARPLPAVTADPQDAIARLKAGNRLFVETPDLPLPVSAIRRRELATGQAPFAAVLSCADSRVPPEVVFHVGLGDLFVVRAAGHVTDRSVLASLEYAVEHLHVPLVVVMGHESCGAVKAAIDTPASESLGPNLDYLLKSIRPAVTATRSAPEASRLRAAILENVEDSVNDLLEGSAILRRAAESGTLQLVGAYYELGTGRVYFSEPVAPGLGASTGAAHR